MDNTYTIVLEQADFLRHQLYLATKSKAIKRKQRANWLLMSGIMLSIGLYMLQDTTPFLAYYFLAFGLATLLFYPWYQKIQYKKNRLKFIDENFKNRFGQENQIGFKADYVVSISGGQEGKIKISELFEFNEIADNLFIQFKTGDSLIIPTRSVNYEKIKQGFKSKTAHLNINWNNESDWEWK